MITFEYQPDGGEPFTLRADSRDVIAWERRKPGRHLGMIEATPRMQDLSELAWLTARRLKQWGGDLAEFQDTVAVNTAKDPNPDADGLLDPTHAGA